MKRCPERELHLSNLEICQLRFVDEHRSGRQDWSLQIWQFLTLELWMQVFLDGRAQEFESERPQPAQAAIA